MRASVGQAFQPDVRLESLTYLVASLPPFVLEVDAGSVEDRRLLAARDLGSLPAFRRRPAKMILDASRFADSMQSCSGTARRPERHRLVEILSHGS